MLFPLNNKLAVFDYPPCPLRTLLSGFVTAVAQVECTLNEQGRSCNGNGGTHPTAGSFRQQLYLPYFSGFSSLVTNPIGRYFCGSGGIINSMMASNTCLSWAHAMRAKGSC